MDAVQKKNDDYKAKEGMTEWTKVADCKSVRVSYVGSNPTSFTCFCILRMERSIILKN